MDPLTAHGFFNGRDPMAAFVGDQLLWGPLAGNESLLAAIRAASHRVNAFIEGA